MLMLFANWFIPATKIYYPEVEVVAKIRIAHVSPIMLTGRLVIPTMYPVWRVAAVRVFMVWRSL